VSNFVGPSYHLQNREVDVQRSINLMPVVNEVAGGKSFAYLESVPGLRLFAPRYGFALLLEDGEYLLLENGVSLLLES
jgi:hypothetical protein